MQSMSNNNQLKLDKLLLVLIIELKLIMFVILVISEICILRMEYPKQNVVMVMIQILITYVKVVNLY